VQPKESWHAIRFVDRVEITLEVQERRTDPAGESLIELLKRVFERKEGE
jgi:hypothetical protein